MRQPSAKRGAMYAAIDLVVWLLNVGVIVVLVTGDLPAWSWLAMAMSLVVVVWLPAMHFRLYRQARRIINAQRTVR